MEKITYRCKKCGWEKSIPEQWADLKPSRCPTKKCRTIFLLEPQHLEIIKPKKEKTKKEEIKKTNFKKSRKK